jgi:hypothetical protein
MFARKATPDRGEEWEELSQAQPEQDRDQKARGGKDDVADTADWLREAKAVGWEPPRSLQLYGTPPSVLSPGSARLTMSLCRSSRSGWSNQSVVPHWDVRVAAARGLVHARTSELATSAP